MANKKLKTIQFPGLLDTYMVPQVENGTNNNVATLDGAGNVKDSAIEVSKVAKTDGSYQNLNAGTSDQLNATVGVTDKVPYNFRTSGGSADIGNRLNDKIVGGTIEWNQLINPSEKSTQTINGITFTNNLDGSWTLDGTASGLAEKSIRSRIYTSGHKMCLLGAFNGTYDTYFLRDAWTNSYSVGIGKIFTCTTSFDIRIAVQDGYTVNQVKVIPQLFDLTQMFGSTIADYIYSLEQTTAGAGVAWFKNLFQKPYYEYNAGELMNVCTNAHITRGFNAYDSSTGMAKLVGGKQYQITGAFASLAYSTGETITPDTNGLFTPTENGVLTVTGGNSSTTCVHLTWSGYRNGEYEPYVEHQYPLSPIELRGIPKLDSASNNLYYDGDTYEKDGTVTRRYGIVDLGTLGWTLNESYFISSQLLSVKYISNTEPFNAKIFNDYTILGISSLHPSTEMCIALYFKKKLFVRDSRYTDAASFKQSLQGVMLVYELATPTTETANPFSDPQIVDDFGTEEYVDALTTAETSPRDVAIPVGHETFYQANLRDKLQNLPANANADGLYLVKQTGNKQELIAYTPEDELPASPAETGTYVLKLVDGTLTWVLES